MQARTDVDGGAAQACLRRLLPQAGRPNAAGSGARLGADRLVEHLLDLPVHLPQQAAAVRELAEAAHVHAHLRGDDVCHRSPALTVGESDSRHEELHAAGMELLVSCKSQA